MYIDMHNFKECEHIQKISYTDVLDMIDSDNHNSASLMMQLFLDNLYSQNIFSSNKWENIHKREKWKIEFYRYKSFFFAIKNYNNKEKVTNDVVIFIEYESSQKQHLIEDFSFFNSLYASMFSYMELVMRLNVENTEGYSENSITWSKLFLSDMIELLARYENAHILSELTKSTISGEKKSCAIPLEYLGINVNGINIDMSMFN